MATTHSTAGKTRFWAARENPEKFRKRVLGAIHAARTKLGLDEDTYRAVVLRVSTANGKPQTSSGKCSHDQLKALADEMRRLGGMPPRAPRKHTPKNPKADRAAQIAKIEALIADAGRDFNYAHGVAKRVAKVDHIEFCDDAALGKVIAALMYDARRHGRGAE